MNSGGVGVQWTRRTEEGSKSSRCKSSLKLSLTVRYIVIVSINPLRVHNIVVHNVSPIYFLYSISTGDQDRSLLSKVVNSNRKNTYVRTLCPLGIIVCITSNQFHVRTLATNYTGSTSNEEHDFHENFLRSTSVRTMWRWYH